jgi:hypothetical protein
MTPEQIVNAASHFEEIPAIQAGKRCGVQWTPWMGDWFTSWSPRNGSSNAEGPWAHWVDLAIRILRDPMTKAVRPDAHQAAQGLEPGDFYDGADRYLSDDELAERFAGEQGSDGA